MNSKSVLHTLYTSNHIIKQHNIDAVVPFHSVFPYKGRLCRQLDKQGSPPNKTSLPISLPLHTGCSASVWFLQTAVYQAETTQMFRMNLQ